MALARGLLVANVVHNRLVPKPHRLAYRVFYLCLPVQALMTAANALFSINKWNLLSFREADHGFGGAGSEAWSRAVLKEHGLDAACNGVVELITMPRVLGYAFNPVSFWFCRNVGGALCAVIAEVNNTFGERHAYLVANADAAPISGDQWLEARKVFHVSPFLDVAGRYRFRFRESADATAVWINYFDDNGHMVLSTSLVGRRHEFSTRSALGCLVRFPLVTLKVIVMIHWEALRMFSKGFSVRRKPPLTGPDVSR